ncbi:hypothetical protein [Nocardia sp. NPDC049526]|uniref:hypothetical protein n=1 Tax=Nocardia sp. NPDC049526 TaxID=3364316 RepID=UPI0037B7AD61
MKNRSLIIRSLGVTRLAVGLSTFVNPRLARRSLGIADRDADGGTVARMFGIRDAALAIATLSNDPVVRNAGVRLGVLADAADTVAIVNGRRAGVTTRGALLMGGAAAFFTVAGIAAWPQSHQDPQV